MNILNPYSKHNHRWRVFTKIYNLGQLEGRHLLLQERVRNSG